MKVTYKLIKWCLAGLLMFVTSQGFTQTTDSMSDYIMDKSGNKITGEVQSFRKSSTPKYIKFKKAGETKFSKYYPENLGGFRVKGIEYISTQVTVNPRTTVSLTGEYNTPEEKIQANVFIQQLFKGNNITLYYANVKGSSYFFIKKDDNFETLYYKKYTVSNEQGSYSGELKKYIGQLKLYLKDCDAIQSKINVVSYSKSSLTRLMKAYVKCSEPVVEEEKKNENRRKFGVIIGVSLAKIKFKTDDPDLKYLSEANFSKALNFYGGLSLQHPYRNNMALMHEWVYVGYRFSGVQGDEIVRKGGLTSIVRIKQSFIKFNNLVKLKYKKSLWYTVLGISAGLKIYEDHSLETVATTVAGFTNNVLPETSILELGLLGGVGIHNDKASLELRLEYANGPSSSPASFITRCYMAASLYF